MSRGQQKHIIISCLDIEENAIKTTETTELMTLSIFRILQCFFWRMQYPSYLVQPQNISNEYTLGVEKYIRNVVDDVANSHGVLVMNALGMLWSGRNTIP